MPVLGTKLHVPTPRRLLVARGRLTDQLRAQDGSMPRLVLVSAPAGFGKTTVVTQWLASHTDVAGAPCLAAWLSLDEADRDVRRFLTHVVAALQTTNPEVGSEAFALLESDRGTPTEEVLVSLVNDLDVAAQPTVLCP
jgi:LuxR family transcriptional regulator, maltose regulon positive regulatory protein